MITTLPTGTNVDNPDPQLGAYTYDQLNRIKRAQYYQENSFNISSTNNALNSGTYSDKYKEKYLFDQNGNILNLWRWDESGAAMDNMAYNYYENGSSTTRHGLDGNYYSNDMTNRLAYVNDAVSGSTPTTDIESGMGSTNYEYDEIGQLIADASEEIEEIQWTERNKVRKIIRTNASTKDDLEFLYDARGNRVAKIVKPDGKSVENGGTDLPNDWEYTYYTLDFDGNAMAIYTADATNNLTLEEQHVYSSERICTRHRSVAMNNSLASTSDFVHNLGNAEYELKNRSGNILVTVSDLPIPKDDAGSDNITDAFEPNVLTAQDYTPYGTIMGGSRGVNNGDSRYGFQGQENDREIKGNGNSLNYEYRMHDPRLGRFLSTDPLFADYAYNSPYAFSENRVIDGRELEGLEMEKWMGGEKGQLSHWMNFIDMTPGELSDVMIEGTTEQQAALKTFESGFLEHATTQATYLKGASAVLGVASNVSKVNKGVSVTMSLASDALSSLADWNMENITNMKSNIADAKSITTKRNIVAAGIECFGCFTDSTDIKTVNGEIKIGQIKPGDQVWSYNEETRTNELKTVLRLFEYERDSLYTIHVGSEFIEATSDHPFYVRGAWIRVRKLQVGDTLSRMDGSRQTISKIDLRVGKFKVYNFEVQDNHTYYVSKLSILVHNCPQKQKKSKISSDDYDMDEDNKRLKAHEDALKGKKKSGSNTKVNTSKIKDNDTSVEKAKNQLDEIEKAKNHNQKNAPPGSKQNKINSVTKSQQRLDNQLKPHNIK